jgi:hypothetical protein
VLDLSKKLLRNRHGCKVPDSWVRRGWLFKQSVWPILQGLGPGGRVTSVLGSSRDREEALRIPWVRRRQRTRGFSSCSLHMPKHVALRSTISDLAAVIPFVYEWDVKFCARAGNESLALFSSNQTVDSEWLACCMLYSHENNMIDFSRVVDSIELIIAQDRHL